MASGMHIEANLKGIDAIMNRMKNLRSDVEDIIDGNIEELAEDIEADAKELAPNTIKTAGSGKDIDDFGQIRNSIRAVKVGKMHSEVRVGVPGPIGNMAAYVEFGTGKYVKIPPGFEQYAMMWYKTGRGTILPAPYLFPALEYNRNIFIEQLKKDLKQIS